MMSGDCQSQGLAEWLQGLVWLESMRPCDLRKLNTPKMRSIWRHLQAHVVSTRFASTMRKNVLLAKLEESTFTGQFGNYKVDSVSTLNKLTENNKVEIEKDKIKDEIKTMDKKLQSEKCNLLDRIVKEEWERHKISEMEDKTMVLELKHTKLLKDCKKTQGDKEMVVHLKSSKIPISHTELSHQKSLVCKYVMNYKYPFLETDDDSEYLYEMMCDILGFKPDAILDGITQNAKEALRSLSSKVDISFNVGNRGSFSKNLSFRENLRDLKVLVIRNELKIHEFKDIISLESNEFKKEKKELVKAIKEIDEDYRSLKVPSSEPSGLQDEKAEYTESNKETDETRSDQDRVALILDDILGRIQEEKVKGNIVVEQRKLMPDDEALEDLTLVISNLAGKKNELWIQVEKKVSEVNMVTSAIFSSLLMESGELNELLAEISQLASDFVTETSLKSKNDTCSSIEFADMVMKEIEVFQRIPMVALLRKWDTSNEMMRVSLAEKFSNNSSLVHFLLQSEEKNCVVNILMKYIWSLSINPQFH